MTGYTVNTGSTQKFSEGWDRIFSGQATSAGAKKKSAAAAPASSSGSKKPAKKAAPAKAAKAVGKSRSGAGGAKSGKPKRSK